MMRRAQPGRSESKLAGLGLGQRDEIRHRLGRQRRRHHEHVGGCDNKRERHEVDGRIVGKLLVQGDVDRHDWRRRHEDGVAVGCRASDGKRPDYSATARPVLDHERLAEPLLQALPQHPRQEFRAAAGRKRHDEGDWACGIRLGMCASSSHRYQRQQRISEQRFHVACAMPVTAHRPPQPPPPRRRDRRR